jgi:hypothetical protein
MTIITTLSLSVACIAISQLLLVRRIQRLTPRDRNRRRMGPPQGSYGLRSDHDWRRSFTHESTNPPSGSPLLRLRRSTDDYQPRPQQGAPNPPSREP